MRVFEVRLRNKSGLHARPASRFASLTSRFKSSIVLCKDSRCVDGKSLLKILSLGVDCGDTVRIMIEGEDEEEASREILFLLETVLPSEDR